MNEVFLDIETIKCQQSEPLREFLTRTIKPPKTMSLPASIVAWHKDKKADAVQDVIDGTGLDGALGQVVCIGYQLPAMDAPGAICHMHEGDLLNHFNDVLNTIPANMHSASTVVGHNVINFDVRFLYQRYIVNGIRPHPIINAAAQSKWGDKCYDTVTQFSGMKGTISLDKLCFALGIDGKGGFTWQDVLPAMLAGRFDDVAAYCKHDVAITKLVYERMRFLS